MKPEELQAIKELTQAINGLTAALTGQKPRTREVSDQEVLDAAKRKLQTKKPTAD